MYAVAAVGLLTVLLSLMMIASPAAFSRGILAFSAKSYFHLFEIASRFAIGCLLVYYADSTLHPLLVRVTGGIFVLAGLILVVGGEKRHREFAVRSAGFERIFRPAGILSLSFGAFIIYSALARV